MQLVIDSKTEALIWKDMWDLRSRMIDICGAEGFFDIALSFDGVACWQSYMSFSGEGGDILPARFDRKRLAISDGLCFVPILTTVPEITLLAQNVGLYQAVLHRIQVQSSLRLCLEKSGPLMVINQFGPHGSKWAALPAPEAGVEAPKENEKNGVHEECDNINPSVETV